MSTEILFSPIARHSSLAINVGRPTLHGVPPTAPDREATSGIVYSPLGRSESFDVLVPPPGTDALRRSGKSDENPLLQRLLLTRERILELRGAFQGLHTQPLASQSGAAARPKTDHATPELDFRARLITGRDEKGSEFGFKGFSIDLLM